MAKRLRHSRSFSSAERCEESHRGRTPSASSSEPEAAPASELELRPGHEELRLEKTRREENKKTAASHTQSLRDDYRRVQESLRGIKEGISREYERRWEQLREEEREALERVDEEGRFVLSRIQADIARYENRVCGLEREINQLLADLAMQDPLSFLQLARRRWRRQDGLSGGHVRQDVWLSVGRCGQRGGAGPVNPASSALKEVGHIMQHSGPEEMKLEQPEGFVQEQTRPQPPPEVELGQRQGVCSDPTQENTRSCRQEGDVTAHRRWYGGYPCGK
ncbi:unnamed protein product [Lampetra planeri]